MYKLKTQAGTVVLIILIISLFLSCSNESVDRDKTDERKLDRYNYEWTTHSSNAAGSMPIGNGDLAANVYVCDGALYLLLSKSDAFDRAGNLIKTGRIKITAQPNPFTDIGSFSQLLNMVSGAIEIEQNGVFFRIWCDANFPVYHIEIVSEEKIRVVAEPEFWERSDGDQDKRNDTKKYLIWTHRNTQSDFSEYLAEYGIEELAESYADPFLNVTTGNLVESPQMKVSGGQLQGSGKKYNIRIHSMRAISDDIQPFISDLEELSIRNKKNTSWVKHLLWWSDFWERSWIIVSDNSIAEENREICTPPENNHRTEADGGFVVAQNYNTQRYLMACMSRGGCQTQFNGGLFTTNITLARHEFDEDGRHWGRRFTFQNQRLLYWPMIHAGDYDLLDPFFNYYATVHPLKKAFTRLWFGHEGSYFRENIQLSGDEISEGKSNGKPPRTKEEANYQKGWHNFHFNATLEIPYMALRRYQHTRDENFKNEVLLPLAREGLLFYDKHYQRDAQGKIRLEPSQALETYWDAINNTPDVAGLKATLEGLLALDDLERNDRIIWERMLREIPGIPIGEKEGKQVILPAEEFNLRHNAETPELYAAFPYDLFSRVKGNDQILRNTMPHRTTINANNGRCWSQDQIQFAYAGMATEAREGLEKRFRQTSPTMRFPMFGVEYPDHVPDLDHNGSGSVALQKMLINESGSKIILLPAWPANWDANFKLHGSNSTVIHGQVKDGVLVHWDITPESRRDDVIICKPQS